MELHFKNFVEISDEEAEKVKKISANRGPFLEHLFNGKQRVVFPLPPTKEMYQIKKIIEKIPHNRYPDMPKYKMTQDDMSRGIVRLIQKNKNPNTGQETVIDKNTTTVGKVLSQERENVNDLKYGDFEYNWNDIRPYWVVVSKHPIDVKRMADFPNLQSCHTFGGDFYHCTDQEVESGGAVAYLINSGDVDQISDKDEIFVDKGFKSATKDAYQIPGRNIEGIHPVARIRIRRAEHNGEEFGLVEEAVYGIDQDGRLAERFKKALREWVVTKQPSQLNKSDLQFTGGTHDDSTPKGLHNLQYRSNSGYINRVLTKLSKLQDNEQIIDELEKLTGIRPSMVMRMSTGKRLWVAQNNPQTPITLFNKTWLAKIASNSIDMLLDPAKIMKRLRESLENNHEVFDLIEKYTVNMLNRGDAKLVKVSNSGWTVVLSAERWIDEYNIHPRVNSLLRPNESENHGVRILVQQIDEQQFMHKLHSLLSKHSTEEFGIGSGVYHPTLGKGVVVRDAAYPFNSVQVRWMDGKLNYVDKGLLSTTPIPMEKPKPKLSPLVRMN